MNDRFEIKIHPITSLSLIGFVFIMVIALWLRVGDGGDLSYFRYDQGRLSLMALEMAHGDAFYWTGPQNSGGLPTSPLVVWFYAILYTINDSPQRVVLAMAVWNATGVALLWGFAHRYFGAFVGFFTALAFAVNSSVIYHSRSVWEPRPLMPFLILAFFVGFFGYVENHNRAKILFLPLLLIALQFHYVAFLLAPIYFVILWIGRKYVTWRTTAISFVLSGIVMLPFLYGIVQSRQDSGNLGGRFGTVLSILTDGPELRWYPVDMSVDIATGRNFSILRNQSDEFDASRPGTLWQFNFAILVAGAILIWWKDYRRYAVFVLAWVSLLTILQIPAWTGSGVYTHYLIPAYPGYALLTGCGAGVILQLIYGQEATRPRMRYLAFGIGGVFTFILFWQGLRTWQMFQYTDDVYNVTEETGQTSTPLHLLMDVREVLQDFDDVILLGANPHESNYYVWEPMLYNSVDCVRDLLIIDGVIDILPAGRFAAVVAPLSPINAGYPVPERYMNDDAIMIPLRPGEDPYIIYPFETAPEWTETPMISIESGLFDADLALNGYYIGDNFLQMRWHVEGEGQAAYTYFVHFFNEEGERFYQRDAPFYVPQHWCDGDTLITSTLIQPLEQDAVKIHVGLYQLDADNRTINAMLLDENNNPVAEWLEIPLE